MKSNRGDFAVLSAFRGLQLPDFQLWGLWLDEVSGSFIPRKDAGKLIPVG